MFKVYCLEDKKLYAVKKAKETYKGHGDRNSKLEEVRKHEFLPPHSNIVRFYKSWEQKGRLMIMMIIVKPKAKRPTSKGRAYNPTT